MTASSGRERAPPLAFEHPVYVTRPLLPAIEAYSEMLQGLWSRRWLTNKGAVHDALEAALCRHLRVTHLSLASSGTTAIMLACRALGLTGEVITTPFTSPATVNALIWCGLRPVFVDIDPVALTLDPGAAERAITANTSAILGVHIFGMPCQVEALKAIADRHGLRLIYDGAHAFGTEIDGEPVTQFGDATILSFHATKIFTTAEGGAVVVPDPETKRRVEVLRNLGLQDESTIALPGLNARMNELEAALGLANVEIVEAERLARAEIAEVYRARLHALDGVSFFDVPPRIRNSQCYFVARIGERCRVTRDQLYERLKAFNVFARRYFYPLCSSFDCYRDLTTHAATGLSIAEQVSREVLSLPFYGDLGVASAHRICDIVEHICRDGG